MSNALIVVDMLRGFCEEGYPLYCGEDSRNIIPFIKQKIEQANAKGDKVIFVCDNHEEGDPEFTRWPVHCLKGTPEAEIIPELSSVAPESVVIPKQRFSGFYNTNLDQIIENLKPERVELVGVCTNICVYFTAEELRNRDYAVTVYRDGVASFDREAHENALKQMDEILGVEVK